jgi:hypothetical protein
VAAGARGIAGLVARKVTLQDSKNAAQFFAEQP